MPNVDISNLVTVIVALFGGGAVRRYYKSLNGKKEIKC